MKEYTAALKFWNDTYAPSDEAQESEDEGLGIDALGCKVMEDELRVLAQAGKILDLGCGSGWASVFLANAGAEVVGVDQSENAVNMSEAEAMKYGLLGVARFIMADENWLKNEPDNEYDGFFSCNLLDVIPTEITLTMLKEVSRIVKSGAPVIISLNPFTDEAKKERLKLTETAPEHYAMDGVLRIVNHTDEEWINTFSEYFEFVELKKFKFDHEPETYIRRLFTLKNK